MVKPEVISDDKMVLLARDICKKIESDLEYPGQIKVNIIRESRASGIRKSKRIWEEPGSLPRLFFLPLSDRASTAFFCAF